MNLKINNKTFAEDVAQRIIEQLKEGTAPWQKPWEGGQFRASFNPVSKTVYKGVNIVQLASRGYNDPRWMTFKQASDARYKIKKGSKATQIVYYQFSKEVDKLSDDGQPMLKEDGTPVKENVQLDRPIMKISYVFNATQIDGVPELEKQEIDWNPEEKAEKIIANSSASISHDQLDRAFYRPSDDSIHMPAREQFSDSQKYYDTILHEISHSTGHSSRMNRDLQPKGTESCAKEELRAEIATWMLSQEIGIPHDPQQNIAYVGAWIKALENDPLELMRASRDAEKIKEYVMGLEHKKELTQEAEQELKQGNSQEIIKDNKLEQVAQEKTYLAVPFKEKEQAKEMGAKWDMEQKVWFAPEGSNLDGLQRWIPEKAVALGVPQIAEPPEKEFAKKLVELGLDLKGSPPICDGKIHRVPLVGRDDASRDGAYCVYTDSATPAGWAQNHVTGEKIKLVATGHVLSDLEKSIQKDELAHNKIGKMREQKELKDKTALRAQEIWNDLGETQENNPYLTDKGVLAFGLKQDEQNNLIVPIQNIDGEIRGLQIINSEGSKRFMTDMEKVGNFHFINSGNENNQKHFNQDEIILCEGYATGSSLHMATSKSVVVAFDANNLEVVGKNLREKYPNAKITICADNDHKLEGKGGINIGIDKAQKTAQAIGAKVKIPVLTAKDKKLGFTDFNDVHKAHGLTAIKKQMGVKKQKELSR